MTQLIHDPKKMVFSLWNLDDDDENKLEIVRVMARTYSMNWNDHECLNNLSSQNNQKFVKSMIIVRAIDDNATGDDLNDRSIRANNVEEKIETRSSRQTSQEMKIMVSSIERK